ncbi:MAG: hypothetical protein ACREML_12595, partial [Vulcanimicrobiaceae bacterium]
MTVTPALAQKAKPSSDPVVARVNGQALTHLDVEITYAGLSPQVRQHVTLEQAYPQIMNQLITMTIAAQAAGKARVEADPIVRKRLSLARDQVLQ